MADKIVSVLRFSHSKSRKWNRRRVNRRARMLIHSKKKEGTHG